MALGRRRIRKRDMNAHVSGNGRLEDYSEEDDCRQCVINGDADAEEESFYECIQE